MSRPALLSSQQHEQLKKWLMETGELYIDLYLVHGGGSGTGYFVKSLEDLAELISKQTWSMLAVTIFRRLQYSLRGLADESLLERGLQQVPEGEWYTIVLLEDYAYPHEPRWCGCGDSHAELRKEFSEVLGRQVGIGQNPFDKDDRWIYATPDEAMVLYFKRNVDHYEADTVPQIKS
jgi:hypothetical protein